MSQCIFAPKKLGYDIQLANACPTNAQLLLFRFVVTIFVFVCILVVVNVAVFVFALPVLR